MEEKIKTFELNAESVNMIVEALSSKIAMWNDHNEIISMHGIVECVQKHLDNNNIRIAKLKTLLDYFLSQEATTASDKHIVECNGEKYAIGFEDWDEIVETARRSGKPISILKTFNDDVYVAHMNIEDEMEDCDVVECAIWRETEHLADCLEDIIRTNNKDAEALASTLLSFADDFNQMAKLQPNEFYTFDYGIVKKEGLSYKSDKYKTNWHYAVKL
jgi:hypothetical protein